MRKRHGQAGDRVFVSHVAEDSEIAVDIAQGLEAHGFPTWYYEQDVVSASFIDQLVAAIKVCGAVVVLLSKRSLAKHSPHMNAEIVEAHNQSKRFIPLLCGVTYKAFEKRRPDWHFMMAGANAVRVVPGDLPAALPLILDGLKKLGLQPRRVQVRKVARVGEPWFRDPRAVAGSSTDFVDYLVKTVMTVTEVALAGGAEIAALEELIHLADELAATFPTLGAIHSLRRQLGEAITRGRTPAEKLRELRREFGPLLEPETIRIREDAGPPKTALQAVGWHALKRFQADPRMPKSDDVALLVFGRSRPVAAFIRYCVWAGKAVKVFTPVMRPAAEGPTLGVVEALAGVKDVEVEVVPDAALRQVIEEGPRHARAEHGPRSTGCDLVLMGCEAGSRGKTPHVVNSLGAFSIACLARCCGKALWILTTELKFGWDLHASASLDATHPRAGQVPASALTYDPSAVALLQSGGHDYPRSEVVPGELISRVITEKGARRWPGANRR